MLITMKDQPPIRVEIREFAMAMEKAMHEHDHDRRDSWRSMTTADIIERLNQELDELKEALVIKETAENPPANIDPMKECVDVANFAMMMWNIAKEIKDRE